MADTQTTGHVGEGALLALAQVIQRGVESTRLAAVDPVLRARIDQTEPGGRYIGTDGKAHDANGFLLDEKNDLSAVAVPTARGIEVVRSEAELDALEAAVKARRESLAAEKEAQRAQAEKEATARETAARAALATREGATSATASDSGEPEEYEERSKDDLQREAERRGIEVKGTGANGSVLKSDLVKALEKADRKG